jgi:hypothetical protein
MAAVPADVQSAEPHAAPGARRDPLLSFEVWRALGVGLGIDDDPSRWLLGDWVAHGRARYGRFYRDAALAATALDHGTLREHAAVARRFDPSRRREELTFRHHAEVCALADGRLQDEWLARAAAGRWSWKELHRRLREADGAPPPPADESVVVAADREQAERWRKAATRSRCALDDWIARALDHAAANAAYGH